MIAAQGKITSDSLKELLKNVFMDTSCLSKIENMLKAPVEIEIEIEIETPVEIERQRPTVQHQMDN